MREKILLALMDQTRGYLSGEKLSQELGITRAAVWKHIKALQSAGFEIHAVQKRGYKLMRMPDRLESALILRDLTTKEIGRDIHYYDLIPSTNLKARDWAQRGAPHGALIIAEGQTQGRGRLGRQWQSPRAQGAYFSLLLRPDMQPSDSPKITMMAAVAVAKAIQELTGQKPGIKWPNDVLLDKKKVCGILTEMSATMDGVEWVVLGIGINTDIKQQDFPIELQLSATSLFIQTGRYIPRAQLIARVLNHFEQIYIDYISTRNFRDALEEYRKYSMILGAQVRVLGPGINIVGTALFYDDQGALMVLNHQNGKRERILSGDVSVRGLMGYV